MLNITNIYNKIYPYKEYIYLIIITVFIVTLYYVQNYELFNNISYTEIEKYNQKSRNVNNHEKNILE